MSRDADPDPDADADPDASDAPGRTLLSVEALHTVFYTDKETVHAVDGASFDVRAGETVGLVGESGSGKSVTARSILGLIDDPGRIEGGRIRFDGTDLVEAGWTDARGDVSIVFQDPQGSLNPVYTVGNQLREVLRIHRDLSRREARRAAVDLLERVGIPDAPRRVDEFPHQFSGGMRQRAAIAAALACDPDLLVCDEPTTALDVTIQAQILDLLEGLKRDEGLGVLLITHDMGVIEEVADRVNVMYAGEIVERASVDALFDDPQHPYTRGLLRSIPALAAGDDRLPVVEGEVPTPTERASDCRFAPRCPAAFDACERVHPDPVAVGPDHDAACLLHDDRFDEPTGVDASRRADAPERDGGDGS